jgi:hypothetical protein
MNPVSDWVKHIWSRLTPSSLYYGSYYELLDRYGRDVVVLTYSFYPHMDPTSALQVLNRGRLASDYRYRHFTKRKPDGSQRELAEPDKRLKAVQQVILKRYLDDQHIHPAAVGFRRKKSIADHVWPHAGAPYIITADIEDFFPSTPTWRVQQWWQSRVNDDHLARFFTLLTTYRGSLPQGAPTSPALSNAVNFELDKALERRVVQSGGTYTRYGDDMVFSWHHPPPADFSIAAQHIIREAGYRLHPTKGWRIYHRSDEPEVTGLILKRDGTVRIPSTMQKRMRRLAASSDPIDRLRLIGYEGYQQMVETRR